MLCACVRACVRAEGASLALKSLCGIFATLKFTAFLPIYLAQLYDSLNTVLMHRDGPVLIAAILSSDFLFPNEFDGMCVVMLLSAYIASHSRQ